jgi:stalled ribosome rescue protein Dom34
MELDKEMQQTQYNWRMSMKNIGLWIDHKKAVIVILSEEAENLQKIESGVGKHINYRGGTHPKSPYSAQYQQGDDQLDRQYIEHLNKFYGKVIDQIRGADSLLIFGPGEAKLELEKRIAHEKVNLKTMSIETVDKMTDRQISAKVVKHYKKQHA